MSEKLNKIVFVKSSSNHAQCPEPKYHEYAFVGRSNVGKSSLINFLAGNSKLAKTSSTPGKTLLINHYLVDESWYLVDLPGYGYAKISKKMREKLVIMLHDYLRKRTNLVCVFVLIDCRIDPQQSDLDFMNFLIINQIPFAIVFTKADKRGIQTYKSKMDIYRKKLEDIWESLPPVFVTSSQSRSGSTEIVEYIKLLNTEIQL